MAADQLLGEIREWVVPFLFRSNDTAAVLEAVQKHTSSNGRAFREPLLLQLVGRPDEADAAISRTLARLEGDSGLSAQAFRHVAKQLRRQQPALR
jgi:hypothetical protein